MSNLILPKRMKIENVEKLVAKLHDNEEYFIHIRTLKQALNHGLVLKKVHRTINFKQNTWLKPYIAMNIGLRKKAKSDIEKDFFKLMNNAVFGKALENVRKHRDIKLVTTEKLRDYFVSELSFRRKFVGYKNEKTQIHMNKPVYLGMSVLELSKTVMHGFNV